MLKKILMLLVCLVLIGIVLLIGIIISGNTNQNTMYTPRRVNITGTQTNYMIDSFNEEYEVYENDSLIASFTDYDKAVNLCNEKSGSFVRKKGNSNNLYENIYRYIAICGDVKTEHKSISEAYYTAYSGNGVIYDSVMDKNIYEKTNLSGNHKISGVPRISQYPELYRGCEITSLCMLFNYKGINKTKMDLANEIFKDNTPYNEEHGVKIYGNPNVGFVGDIYSKDKKGYGVYHKPIYNLTEAYFGTDAVDLTGSDAGHIYWCIEKNNPVWVIVNSKFKPLQSSYFEKWYTSEGEIEITYSEHAVLITGYDSSKVYFNDPMNPESEKSADRKEFEAAWKQMGSQAVTVLK